MRSHTSKDADQISANVEDLQNVLAQMQRSITFVHLLIKVCKISLLQRNCLLRKLFFSFFVESLFKFHEAFS